MYQIQRIADAVNHRMIAVQTQIVIRWPIVEMSLVIMINHNEKGSLYSLFYLERKTFIKFI